MSLFNPEESAQGILAKMETKAKESGTVQVLVLRFETVAQEKHLLEALGTAFPAFSKVPEYFREDPTPWRLLSLDMGHRVAVELDAGTADAPKVLEFVAVLKSLKVSRSYKKGVDVYTYTLGMEKELEPETDRQLVHFVNAKAISQRTGKPELVTWAWTVSKAAPEPEEQPED